MIRTHKLASEKLIGKPVEVKENEAIVKLKTTEEMIVDEKGLIHGGFTFGLADYAAMLAVNHPNVVLGKAEVKFTRPVKVGDEVVAHAKVIKDKGKEKVVEVTAKVVDNPVLKGVFYCYVLEKHVLDL